MVACKDCANCVNPERASDTWGALWCRTPRVDRTTGGRELHLCSTERLFGWHAWFSGECGKSGRFFVPRAKVEHADVS